MATASVRSTISFSLKCFFTSAKTSSGMCVSDTLVAASVQARAARSRSLKKGVSRQAFKVYSRCSLSPSARASTFDLGGAHLDQKQQFVIEAAVGEIVLDVVERLQRFPPVFSVVNPRLHLGGTFPWNFGRAT